MGGLGPHPRILQAMAWPHAPQKMCIPYLDMYTHVDPHDPVIETISGASCIPIVPPKGGEAAYHIQFLCFTLILINSELWWDAEQESAGFWLRHWLTSHVRCLQLI